MNKQTTFVIGHKNPDTDSICSAIAYANFKNKINTVGNYIPFRAGDVNNETKFVLDYFNVQTPALLTDVGTQVADMNIQYIEGVSKNISLREAWTIMRTNMLNTLPITKNQHLEGIITITDITKQNMDVFDNYILAKAKTPYQNLINTLEGTLLTGNPDISIDAGKIVIGAADTTMFAQYIDASDIVILGNREDNQLLAIEKNARCLIICLNASVSQLVLTKAQEMNCHVIVTPFDTYTASRLISQSIPLSYIMRNEKLVTFTLDTPSEEAKMTMAKLRHRDFPVLNEQGEYVGMVSRRSFLDMHRKQVILVDHNEKTQTIDGIGEADILEIIDHHRLGGVETISPVYFRNQPLGSTATIITQMYIENNLNIEKDMAGLLCSAILSDTLMFRSPTCTQVDIDMATKLSEIANINIEEFAIKMFSAGSDFDDKTDEEILHQDYKVFHFDDTKFGVGQVSVIGQNEVNKVKERLKQYVDEHFENEQVQMLFFLLTDILEESSTLLVWGQNAKSIARTAFPEYISRTDEIYLPGVISRKKQFIPQIMQTLQEL